MTRGALPVLLMLLTVGVFLGACGGGQKTEIVFFYDALCPGCEDRQRAEDIEGSLRRLARSSRSYRFESHNVAVSDGEQALNTRLAERGLEEISRSLPLLLIDDRYLVGLDDIETEVERLLEQERE